MSKKNLHFKHLRLNYINSQKKQTEKEHLRLVISSIRVGMVAKTDKEVYILFFFFFLCGFFFTNIHESQDCRRRGRAFL